MQELLYSSPILMGLGYLFACTVASVSILYFCRPARGPGYWAGCCGLLVVGFSLFAVDHFIGHGWRVEWLVNLLLVLAQACMILGVFRFMGQPPPFWIIPASALPMLAVDLWRLLDPVPQTLVDALYSAIVVGLALKPLDAIRRTRESGDARSVRNFIVGALIAYALAHLARLAIGLYQAYSGDGAGLFQVHSVPTFSFYSGLPFLIIALVALTAMSLHRTLAESRNHAELAKAHLLRFEQLMHVSSAAMLLIRDGLIADSNPKLGELFGCRPEVLHDRCFVSLFHPQTDPSLLNTSDEHPHNLIALRADGTSFQSEVTVKPLDGHLQLAEIRDVSRQKALEAQLALLASTDPLTGTLNRRAFHERYPQALERARGQGTALSLALLDLDHFKRINDLHGHGVGDAALKTFVAACRRQARSEDLFARIGGEEFALLFSDCGVQDAAALLERIRQELRQLQGSGSLIAFSAGITDCLRHESLDGALQSADKALYRAKRNGRGRTEEAD